MLTGRHPNELPPNVVRGLMWRAYVDRALALIQASRLPINSEASVQARIDHAELVKLADRLTAEVFPDG